MRRLGYQFIGLILFALALAAWTSLVTWSIHDPSFNHATRGEPANLLGTFGAAVSDMSLQLLGLAAITLFLPLAVWGWHNMGPGRSNRVPLRLLAWPGAILFLSAALASLPRPTGWPLPNGLGGIMGDLILSGFDTVTGPLPPTLTVVTGGLLFAFLGIRGLLFACHIEPRAMGILLLFERRERPPESAFAEDEDENVPGDATTSTEVRTVGEVLVTGLGAAWHGVLHLRGALRRVGDIVPRRPEPDPLEAMDVEGPIVGAPAQVHYDDEPLATPTAPPDGRIEPFFGEAPEDFGEPLPNDLDAPMSNYGEPEPELAELIDDPDYQITRTVQEPEQRPVVRRIEAEASPVPTTYTLPPLKLLKKPTAASQSSQVADGQLQENARLLESVLADFGVKGEIINVRPGPVVTLYELEPAPGTKSSRVVGLADDIARSMSAIAARVAVIPGRNAIGIELPNESRAMVFLRALFQTDDFSEGKAGSLLLALGKDIGGGPVTVDLARMPHLLIAGTTGSGKSVGINTMILSLLYRLTPEQCKFIMIDPKMLELSVYDGIPHLLAPVVTDPKKAVVALKWTVKEMEDRYKKMSKLGVRNIHGYNERVVEAQARGEPLTRTVQTGFDRETGQAVYEQEEMDYQPLPYIVVIVDEMADLMMVAGKDIEGAVQRLAQMARAAGIHMITATQRPSVDVITGTIKANFPTRISFQVTSKIDSRTILGEQGAEQLLGQGDMLYMAGGGRIMRVHGPFVSDDEVEKIVGHLKKQGVPEYLDAVTEDDGEDGPAGEDGGADPAPGASGNDLYDQAVAIVLRDGKASTSYVQRRLSIGYNRAASLIERMEQEGVISPANHAGKREILVPNGEDEQPY